LIDSLPQLHTFVNTMGPKMSLDDRLQIYEAVGYVISSMPLTDAAPALRTFAFDILGQIHAVASASTSISKEHLRLIAGESL
jgi:transportin-3